MSRKSALTINLLCGVSFLTLAGSTCLVNETAEAAPAGRKAFSAQVSKAGGIGATRLKGRHSSPRSRSLSAPRRALQPKGLAARTVKGRNNERRIGTAAPVAGNSRLSVLGTDSRLGKLHKATTGRNPRTGKTMQIAPSRVAKFKAGKALKDAVNGQTGKSVGRVKLPASYDVTIGNPDRKAGKANKKKPREIVVVGSKVKDVVRNAGIAKKKDVTIIQSTINGNRVTKPSNEAVYRIPGAGLAMTSLQGADASAPNAERYSLPMGYGIIVPEDGGNSGDRGLPTGWKAASEDGETGFLGCLLGSPIACGLAVGFFVGTHIDLNPKEPTPQCSFIDGTTGPC